MILGGEHPFHMVISLFNGEKSSPITAKPRRNDQIEYGQLNESALFLEPKLVAELKSSH